ncbi:hypothetical protein ACE6H2_015078 [Prunus campanulata]
MMRYVYDERDEHMEKWVKVVFFLVDFLCKLELTLTRVVGFELLTIWIVLTFLERRNLEESVSVLSFSTKWLVHHF